jgi:predicted adenine nucleotide alpha hydrolase (AANH) superfamily ATPase
MNYQKQLEEVIKQEKNNRKKLLLHSCCAPCSSYVLEYLREYFDITVFFYNPNISNSVEYEKRLQEEIKLIEAYNKQVENGDFENMNSTENARMIKIMEVGYEPSEFFEAVKGYEHCKEGGERCYKCFELRLRKSAKVAKEGGFDYFTTTLTISPLKNANWLNEIGRLEGEKEGVLFLPSDFKKKDGYKRSIQLSKDFDLYRQDFCGCGFSKAEMEERRKVQE